jgi:hypothetical protein
MLLVKIKEEVAMWSIAWAPDKIMPRGLALVLMHAWYSQNLFLIIILIINQ